MKKNIKTLLVIFILIISYIIINLICGNKAFALTQTTTTDINSIDSNKYPQIKEILQSLQKEHPKWKFKILYTDIEWSDAIANEYVGHGASPRNLVPANNSNYGGDWICKACGAGATYDSGNWHCASEAAIAYMMDARNSTNASDIFQFMELTYSECNIEAIKTMVAGTFLNNESYINAIIQAAQTHNVNAYYIVARILQEQGTDGSTLSKGQGYNGQYVGYYNIFNIGANGNGKETVILNGLKKAQSYEWTTLESSIIGGTKIIAKSYIARGQNTLYFQKFDVENSDGNLYWHQYMQNILAAQNEGKTLRKTFNNIGAIDGEYTFIIPLYKNMPQIASPRPSTTSSDVITGEIELVKVNVSTSLRIRNQPNGEDTVGWVYKDEIVTRLVKATEKVGGTYWDYVLKGDGTKGYSARETFEGTDPYKLYLIPINNEEAEESKDSASTTVIKNEKVEIDMETNIIKTIPGATVQDLVSLMTTDVVIKNTKGEVLSPDSKLGTGCVINDSYTVMVLGDVNGDGQINTIDAARALKASVGNYTFEGIYFNASDVNGDGKINTIDAARLLKAAVGNYKIEI